MILLAGRFLVLLSCLGVSLYLGANSCRAAGAKEQRTAAEILPSSTAIYAEIALPKEVLDTAWEHPVYEKLRSLDAYQHALKTPKFGQFQFLVGAIEAQIGMSWRDAFDVLTAGGIYAAVDGTSGGAILLIRSGDADKLASIAQTMLRLAENEAKRQGNAHVMQSDMYRGLDVYQVGEAHIALMDEWLVVTNEGKLGQRLLDRYLDNAESGQSLARTERFEQAVANRPDFSAWAFIDVASLREAGVAKKLFQGRAENPAAEVLIGGLLSTLQHTPYATLTLDLDAQHLQFTAAMPHDASLIGEERHYFFGPEGQGTAEAPLRVSDGLLSISTYRNVSQMWLHAPDLFDENVNANLSQTDSNLSTLFGGRDFGEEILGAFGPEIQIVAVQQTFQNQETQPAIRLPAAAIVFRLRDQETMQPELRRTFQSLIGFLNIVGAMKGQPQLDLDLEKTKHTQIVTARYLATQTEKGSKDARLQFNFSPSVAFRGDRFVLASTEQLARELIAAEEMSALESVDGANTWALLDVDVVGAVLADNRDQLVARTMLSEGHDKQTAEQQIDALFQLLDAVEQATLRLATQEGELALRLKVDFE